MRYDIIVTPRHDRGARVSLGISIVLFLVVIVTGARLDMGFANVAATVIEGWLVLISTANRKVRIAAAVAIVVAHTLAWAFL